MPNHVCVSVNLQNQLWYVQGDEIRQVLPVRARGWLEPERDSGAAGSVTPRRITADEVARQVAGILKNPVVIAGMGLVMLKLPWRRAFRMSGLAWRTWRFLMLLRRVLT